MLGDVHFNTFKLGKIACNCSVGSELVIYIGMVNDVREGYALMESKI
jgi:hypothetical protein